MKKNIIVLSYCMIVFPLLAQQRVGLVPMQRSGEHTADYAYAQGSYIDLQVSPFNETYKPYPWKNGDTIYQNYELVTVDGKKIQRPKLFVKYRKCTDWQFKKNPDSNLVFRRWPDYKKLEESIETETIQGVQKLIEHYDFDDTYGKGYMECELFLGNRFIYMDPGLESQLRSDNAQYFFNLTALFATSVYAGWRVALTAPNLLVGIVAGGATTYATREAVEEITDPFKTFSLTYQKTGMDDTDLGVLTIRDARFQKISDDKANPFANAEATFGLNDENELLVWVDKITDMLQDNYLVRRKKVFVLFQGSNPEHIYYEYIYDNRSQHITAGEASVTLPPAIPLQDDSDLNEEKRKYIRYNETIGPNGEIIRHPKEIRFQATGH